ncbi:glycoside hydrolase family 20 protein [Neolentinus lepideus HHB14362 ss-1]|uniref:beta-N-acetylhexosaminidase n=1 Tax=Neolentinus lepideus HHB14362 ss-1 TaxID=1314782 RepID=A0A165TRD0_9AGAM|nr:glycoside hydrolase family 20 protein [Neolentinus lepideus HHB14362 ss-1]
MFVRPLLLLLLALGALAYNLNVLPQPRSWTLTSGPAFPLFGYVTIVVDSAFQNYTDTDGMTLIPPSLHSFTSLFASDLGSAYNSKPAVVTGTNPPPRGNAIFLTVSPNTTTLLDGTSTSEGYHISVSANLITITGSGARGAWWATRTLLQGAALNGGWFPAGEIVDGPDYSIRGHMLDAARHWYSAEYLTEFCHYMSFFKLNEFHVHLSDNVYPYDTENWRSYYARFRFWSDNPAFAGLAQKNESYDEATFAAFQSSCAARGVTIVPEIEAPGHAMPFSLWQDSMGKQVYIDTDPTLLNLSIPGVTEMVESVWTEFLPWFQTKEVTIGADEYPSDLADSYINFVNDLNTLIKGSGKHIRAWGTDEPSNTTSIDKDVTIQHWALFATDPYALIQEGYPVINSQDWIFYEVLKYSDSYPPVTNLTRFFDFGDPPIPGLTWNTSLFNWTDIPYNPSPTTPLLRGAIAPVWNDNGPRASTDLEAFYETRVLISVTGALSWGANGLKQEAYESVREYFENIAPGQNLNRFVTSKGPTVLSYDFSKTGLTDSSGNGYNAHVSGPEKLTASGLVIPSGGSLTTLLGSLGLNHTYTLALNLSLPSTILKVSGPDTILTFQNGQPLVIQASNGAEYPLRDITTNATTAIDFSGKPVTLATTQLQGTGVWMGGKQVGWFGEPLSLYNNATIEAYVQMAFVAPLSNITVQGGGLATIQSWTVRTGYNV